MDLFASESARWIIAAWFLFLGGAVGSFLNVVVYRLPAGMSVSWPGSHCPRCKHSIRSYDNVPVVAWLWLRGRCRDCGGAISIRYPLVEAVTAGLFLLLLVVEVFHGGHNLPQRFPPAAAQATAYPPAIALSICLLHLGLLCTLLAAGLIAWDDKRPPWRLFAPFLLVGFIAPMIWPWLHPQPTGPAMAHSRLAGAIDSMVGLAAGYYLGRLTQWLGRRFARLGPSGYEILAHAMLLGVVLGWQSAIVLLPLAMLLDELSRIVLRRPAPGGRFSAAVWLAPLTLLWILNWARIAAIFPTSAAH